MAEPRRGCGTDPRARELHRHSRRRRLQDVAQPDHRGPAPGGGLAESGARGRAGSIDLRSGVYAETAEQAGHTVTHIDFARIDFPPLQTADRLNLGVMSESLKPAAVIATADQVALTFPP